jgi:hypothetical protein
MSHKGTINGKYFDDLSCQIFTKIFFLQNFRKIVPLSYTLLTNFI